MKKTSYALIGFLLIFIMLGSPIVSVQGTPYNCTGVVGAEATWKVKTVNNGTLEAIFGPTWQTTIEMSFLPGSSVAGAKMKSKITYVNTSYIHDTSTVYPFIPMAPVDACLILSDVWYWTTDPFNESSPDASNVPTVIFSHPENLTTYCQLLGVFISLFAGNVSQRNALGYLNGLLVPAEDYLADLLWDNDYLIDGTTVTHTITITIAKPIYFGWFGNYFVNCTETWRYSKSYGTFLGYKLVHNNGTTAYETVLVTPSAEEIPGFELLVLTGTSIGTILCVIYVIMKKK